MAHTFFRIHLAVMLFWLPGAAWACAYPAPLRSISATLMSVQHTGGQVGTYHRARLDQALGRTDAAALLRDIGADLGRADRRAVAAVLTLAASLAKGVGLTIHAADAEQVLHLAAAIRTACPASTTVTTRAAGASAAREQDQTAAEVGGTSALTFRQSLARLSLIFSIYLTCLAMVIGLRRQWKRSVQMLPGKNDPPPGGRAFSPNKTREISGF